MSAMLRTKAERPAGFNYWHLHGMREGAGGTPIGGGVAWCGDATPPRKEDRSCHNWAVVYGWWACAHRPMSAPPPPHAEGVRVRQHAANNGI